MIKTALYSLSYLDGFDASGSSRFDRQIKYVKFYESIKEELGFDRIEFYDNGSSMDYVKQFLKEINCNSFIRETFHLQRGLNYDYPYCWRGLHHIRRLILEGYDKIICIDSDTFVLTKRLANYIKNSNSGWEAFWSPKYQWPTSEFHILNKDKFEFFMGYTSTPWERMNGQCQERALPFSKITKSFIGDRYGEMRIPQQPEHDYYGQCAVETIMEFQKNES